MRRSIASLAILGAALLLASPTQARELDGAQVYRDNCGRCHQPRTPADLSPDGWRAVSFHMRVKGNLTPAEFYAIEDFLIPELVLKVPDAVSILDGNLLASQVCLSCHDTQRIEDAVLSGRTEEQWLASLGRMRTYGAQFSAEEAEELSSWLSTLTIEREQ